MHDTAARVRVVAMQVRVVRELSEGDGRLRAGGDAAAPHIYVRCRRNVELAFNRMLGWYQ